MSVVLPIDNASPDVLPSFDYQYILDGVTYTLEFGWNGRFSSWFMNLYDATGEVLLLAGVRIVSNFPLAVYVTGRKPAGLLIASDTSGSETDAALDDFGDRVHVLYFTAADLGF